ncbi:MAG: NAD(P)H-dependent oxidoreductase [Candidatus Andeanibacterium colombiense]|uniref:NAD(P)H-dependent oxidoreductase n=1 Tax=Candidatus Andeanibacterium colombiense TaxID=3121345 RepID=A0AAJ5X5X3_9SPHN|nr:MAG: NAD(P)H-dependent oxidoreductase [Sphingomonadaceae bacterium]
MTQPLRILVILGSVREGRVAEPVGNWVIEQAAGREDIALELVDLKAWALPPYPFPRPPAMGGYTDPLQLAWAEKIAGADGYILIAPEYNHGIPAALKNALDFVYAEWARKPVGFVGYGGAGGARSIEGLTQVARSLQMAALEAAVHIMGVNGKIADGRFTGEGHDTGSLARLFDQLRWWGNTLKAAR